MRLITGFCPNKSMRRMIEKGEKLLVRELDLIDLIKRNKHHHKLLSHHEDHKNEIKDTLDIDQDSDLESSCCHLDKDDSKQTNR